MARCGKQGGARECRSAVSAAWIVPEGAVRVARVAHGAGAGMDHPFLVGFCRAMADEGIAPRGSTSTTWTPAAVPGRAARRSARRGTRRSTAARSPPAASRCWPAASRSADGSPRCASPTGCGPRGSCSSAIRCIPRASRTIRAEHLYGSTCRCCSCRERGTRSPSRSCSARCSTSSATVRRSTRSRAATTRSRSRARRPTMGVGASLASVAAPFVRRVAGGG